MFLVGNRLINHLTLKRILKNKRRVLATTLLITYFIFIVSFILSINQLSSEVFAASDERSYLFPINLNLNGTQGFDFGDPEITLCMNFTYPEGTLVVDKSVNIIGLSVLRGKAMDDVDMILLTFQNCLRNDSYDVFHFPKQAFLVFNNSASNRGLTFDDSGRITYIMCDETNAYWSMDGDYNPVVGIFYSDNTNKTMVIDDVIIHVYPREELTQMQSNSVNLTLSIAGLVLSSVVIVDLFINLWNSGDNNCKYVKRTGWAILSKRRNRLKKKAE